VQEAPKIMKEELKNYLKPYLQKLSRDIIKKPIFLKAR
jgi:hypothetical protein